MRLLISNTYRGNRRKIAYRRQVRKVNPAALIACEADTLGRIRGYIRPEYPGMSRPARAVGIYVRKGIPIHYTAAYRLAPAIPGARYPEERWAAETRIVVSGKKWALFSVHMHPLTGQGILAGNRTYVARLGALMEAARAAGYAPVAAGDWNELAHEASPLSATLLANRLGGRMLMQRRDGIVVGKGITLAGLTKEFMPGSDHSGWLAEVHVG